ncbi:hypothetical protein JOD57_000383 [Geodermatophilus bullaregiensis]|nr:hypothetical protein [Geodermatophilus bullaregiensis]
MTRTDPENAIPPWRSVSDAAATSTPRRRLRR